MSTTIDPETATSSSEPDAVPTRRRRWPWVVAAVAVVASAVTAAVTLGGDDAAQEGEVASTRNFVDVVRTDLVQVESYDATLGTVAGDPIRSQQTGTITSTIEEGTTAAAGDVIYTIDGDPVVLMDGTVPAWRPLALTDDPDQLINRRAGTITAVVDDGAVVEEGDVVYEIDGEPVVIIYGSVPAYRTLRDAPTNLEGDDVLQLETYLDAAGYDDVGIAVDGEFTGATESVVENWQEAIGATVDGVVDLGEVIFVEGPLQVRSVAVEVGDAVVAGAPVLTFEGSNPTEGDDVAQLERNLAAFGYDPDGILMVDGVFDEATKAAVEAWQAAAGMEVDGIVDLGEVVFVDGAIRVSDVVATPGTAVNPGAIVLAISSADKVVTLNLPAEDQDVVEVGQAVTVELPDGTDTAGTITDVATVATVTQQGATVFEVTVELDDPEVAADLDQAPVDVEIVTDSVQDVLAVPVTALLALAEGGYAVEVETAGGTRLVAVDPGFFASGLVEVVSDELVPGDRVVVP